jgi:hypothetical protein
MTISQLLNRERRRWGLPVACSGVATASFGIIVCAAAGPVRLIAGLSLLCAFACAVWLLHRPRLGAIVPAIGLTLAFLILAGLALAAVHALGAVPAALAMGIVTVAAAWASAFRVGPGPAERNRKPLSLLAVAGAATFAAAAVLAVHYAAVSATADADRASSLAIWAYPSGDQLQIGLQAPAGQPGVSLRIVVTQAEAVAAEWNNVRIAPGQTWEAPALTLTGNGPVQVVALHAGAVVASLSASLPARCLGGRRRPGDGAGTG